jgi:hypothetical protein
MAVAGGFIDGFATPRRHWLCVGLVVIGVACGRGGAEDVPYPFQDGDSFEFSSPMPSHGMTRQARYVVEKAGDGFVVRHFVALESDSGQRSEAQIHNSEKVYDRYGRLIEMANGNRVTQMKGHYCLLWLEPGLRQLGASVRLSEDAREGAVTKELRRNDRDVLLVTVGSREYYFDKSSGYLVEQTDFGELVKSTRGPV